MTANGDEREIVHDGLTLRPSDGAVSKSRRTAEIGESAVAGSPGPAEAEGGGAVAAPPDTPSPPSPGSTTHVGEVVIATPAALGKRFGPYVLKSELGRGGMGIVYLAEHVQLKRDVALKIMLAAELASPRARHRFQREAEAAAALHHQNIIGVHDIGEECGRI